MSNFFGRLVSHTQGALPSLRPIARLATEPVGGQDEPRAFDLDPYAPSAQNDRDADDDVVDVDEHDAGDGVAPRLAARRATRATSAALAAPPPSDTPRATAPGFAEREPSVAAHRDASPWAPHALPRATARSSTGAMQESGERAPVSLPIEVEDNASTSYTEPAARAAERGQVPALRSLVPDGARAQTFSSEPTDPWVPSARGDLPSGPDLTSSEAPSPAAGVRAIDAPSREGAGVQPDRAASGTARAFRPLALARATTEQPAPYLGSAWREQAPRMRAPRRDPGAGALQAEAARPRVDAADVPTSIAVHIGRIEVHGDAPGPARTGAPRQGAKLPKPRVDLARYAEQRGRRT